MIGEVFGKLTVLERCGSNRWREAMWLCRCDCGEQIEVRGKTLRSGQRSCGCEATRKLIERSKRHGRRNTSEYVAWRRMIDRCGNPKRSEYADYGGRGIAVCLRWQSFENFFADMGCRPSPKHSLDRRDNDRGYEPGNCRWATAIEQQNNRRSNSLAEFDGRTQTLAQWEREFGLTEGSLCRRLHQGWPIERALMTPNKGARRRRAVALRDEDERRVRVA